ncbi:biliverdin-producing heme oxygenase [Mucilaginibacter galii]|uniref:Heme oxygenase n=1 Tax=Mucilaginibacter galii TaxID=2005073 RepID=A0A917N1J0_9SPHI|nr:biliverdin-producing heme oxygenase [Mucilaginibacter galii]GGI50916.1 heme oxygenase [Mucilaginibacter galii]
MLADLLKKDTLSNHQQLEKILVARMKAIRSKQDYIDLLQLFYSYFGGLEKLIDRYLDKSIFPDYDQRRKSASLAHDINILGGTLQNLATGSALPAISNTLQAMAALYVIEGSTLGGRFISKMIAQQLHLTDNAGLSFFNSYGDNTETMWNIFKEALDKQGTSSQENEEVVTTANYTFARFKDWAQRTLA